jgi:hypothetical protein
MPSAHEFRRRVRRGFSVRPVAGPDAKPSDVVRRSSTHHAVQHQAFEIRLHRQELGAEHLYVDGQRIRSVQPGHAAIFAERRPIARTRGTGGPVSPLTARSGGTSRSRSNVLIRVSRTNDVITHPPEKER